MSTSLSSKEEVAAEGDRASFRRILSGAGLLTVARVAGDLASALLFIAISRSFGVEGIGLYAYAFAVAGIAQLALNFGLDDYGLREYASRPPGERPQLLANALVIQLGLLVVVALALWGYLTVSGAGGETVLLVWLLAGYQLLLNFATMLFIPPIRAQRMLWPAVAELTCRAGGSVLAALIIVTMSVTLVQAMVVLPASAVCLLIAAVLIARRHNGPLALHRRVAVRHAWPVLRSASTFAVSGLIVGLYARFGLIFLTFVHGAAATGLYSTGLKLLDLGMAPLLLLGIAVYPRLASSYGRDPEDLAEIANNFVRLTVALSVLVLWGMVFVVPPLLPFVLGPEFEAAKPVVQLMGVVAFLTALDLAAARLLWAMRMQNQRLRIQAIGLAANIALNVILIPPLAVTGTILAALSTLVLMLVLGARLIVRAFPAEHWLAVGRACLLPGVAGLAAGTVALIAIPSPWLAGPLTLVVFTVASLKSGLVSMGGLGAPRGT